MRRHFWSLATLAALVVALPCQLQVKLTGVPENLILPVPAGHNVVITATVTGGEADDAWLARTKDGTARVPLLPAGDGIFQLNLATAALGDLLRTPADSGALTVFVRDKDGTVAASVAIAYALRADARRPSLVVYEQDRTRRIDTSATTWLSPRAVTRIDVDLLVPTPTTDATARIGGRRLTLAATEAGGARLEVTADVAEAWLRHGDLEIGARTDPDAPVFRLRARPERLCKDGAPVSFECAQRSVVSAEGTRDYLRVSLGDITGGRVRVRVYTAEGETLVSGQFVRQGEAVTFAYEGLNYALTVDTLVNSLLGQDYAKLRLAPAVADERALITGLLDAVRTSPLTFVRNGAHHDGAAAAKLLSAKYQAARAEIATVEAFISGVGTRSSTSGKPYLVRTADGTERELAGWLAEQVAALRTAAKAGAHK